MDNYFDFLQKTISSYPTGASELGEKLKSYGEKNIAPSHDFLLNVGRARDFSDILRIQNEFMQMQMNAFSEQTKKFRHIIYQGSNRRGQHAFQNILRLGVVEGD